MPWLKQTILLLIRGYQTFVSPLFPPRCRFQPTCSHYALEAVERYGPIKGSWLAIHRILRCHPFHAGGYDPVPLAPLSKDPRSNNEVRGQASAPRSPD